MAACARRVWLVLGASSIDCHDESAGYFVTSFDPGSPDVRAVSSNRPDADGLDDLTQFMGGRVVSVEIAAIATAGAVIDEVAAMFGPFMVPSARPEIHYVLDRPGAPERVLIGRPQSYSYKIDDAYQRDVALQFVAADPVARDPAGQSAIAWAGSSGNVAGRRYDLTFDRIYPAGSASPTPATISTPGDVAVAPLLQLYGPITGARVLFKVGATNSGGVGLVASYVIGSGHYVEIDCAQRTARLDGDPTKSVLTSIDWNYVSSSGGWPTIPPASTVTMTYSGTSTTSATQVVATWNDGYLT